MSYSDDQPPAPVGHLLKHNTIPTSVLNRTRFSLDTELIKAEQQKALQKALAAQELLPKNVPTKNGFSKQKEEADSNQSSPWW